MTEDAVRDLLRARAKRYAVYRGSSGIKGWRKAKGVSNSHASEFMNGKRLPTTDLLDALNLEWRIVRKKRY